MITTPYLGDSTAELAAACFLPLRLGHPIVDGELIPTAAVNLDMQALQHATTKAAQSLSFRPPPGQHRAPVHLATVAPDRPIGPDRPIWQHGQVHETGATEAEKAGMFFPALDFMSKSEQL